MNSLPFALRDLACHQEHLDDGWRLISVQTIINTIRHRCDVFVCDSGAVSITVTWLCCPELHNQATNAGAAVTKAQFTALTGP